MRSEVISSPDIRACILFFFFQAEDGIRDYKVTGVQTCALPISSRADLIMSVCTGAFVLAQTGLLDGKTATTHHDSYAAFQAPFPKVELVRGQIGRASCRERV